MYTILIILSQLLSAVALSISLEILGSEFVAALPSLSQHSQQPIEILVGNWYLYEIIFPNPQAGYMSFYSFKLSLNTLSNLQCVCVFVFSYNYSLVLLFPALL